MLGKLMKHEFRATRRVMLPLYLILLVTAVAANFSTRMLFDSRHWALTTLGTLLVISFGVAVAGVCVMSVLLMVQRFYKNLLQDEGYIMLTLPASIHQHVWAKLIVSAAWFVVTVVVVIAAGCVMAFDIGVIRDFFEGLWDLLWELRKLEAFYAFNGVGYLAELAALAFFGLAAMCLQFYAALAIGHSAANHKMVCSVGAFFALQFATQFLASTGLYQLSFVNWPGWQISGMAAIHVGMLVALVCVVVYGAIFYAVTVYFLNRRLNLE